MRRAWLCVLPLLLAGCYAAREPKSAQAVAATPAATALQPAHYHIDAAQSQVLVLVYRAGRLASLGHNHVIAVRRLRGEVSIDADPNRSTLSLSFPVAALSIDEPALRAAQGADFAAPVDSEAINGTRVHLLGARELDATHYGQITLAATGLRADPSRPGAFLAELSIQVRNHLALVRVPILLQQSAGRLEASGEFDLDHSTLGLTPYSVAFGALRVAERMHVRYRLLATG